MLKHRLVHLGQDVRAYLGEFLERFQTTRAPLSSGHLGCFRIYDKPVIVLDACCLLCDIFSSELTLNLPRVNNVHSC